MYVRVLVMCAITAVVSVLAALNPMAGHTVRPYTDLDLANAKHYAAWCGGYVQVERGTEVTVQGCDR